MSAIELVDITKHYASVTAVRDFSLSIERGELIALVGPSGCGKTTLLRTIAGFERPDSGDIRFDGVSILSREPERRRVGVVFQDYALFPHMSVAKNIGYGLRFVRSMGRNARRRRVEELLEMVGLAGYGDRAPHELSAGQQQRIAIARALAPEPEVLLLDEPMSALDALLREELRSEVKRLQKELEITTVHVTHDQEEAIAIADRVAVMRNGRIEQVGRPEEIYFEPSNEFVAHFVGRGNLLQGFVERSDATTLTLQIGDSDPIVVARRSAGSASAAPRRPESDTTQRRATIVVRPNRIVLGSQRENRVHGEVIGVEFLGELTRLSVRTGGGEASVVIDSKDAPQWKNRLGELVELSFHSEDAWLLPDQIPPEQAAEPPRTTRSIEHVPPDEGSG